LSQGRPVTLTKDCLYGLLLDIISKCSDYFELQAHDSRKCILLFTAKGTSDHSSVVISTNEEVTKRVVDAAMTCGIIHTQIALVDDNMTDFSLNDNSKSTHNAKEFILWFSKVTNNRILVLDTNAIMHRALSSLRFTIDADMIHRLTVYIPRLSVLEMERSANIQGRKAEEKRLIMSAAAELFFLKRSGAILLPQLEKETFEAFSHVANDQITDSWIRREIEQAIEKEEYLKEEDKIRRVTLFTADLINALSAIAEGIDTMFISLVDYDKTSTRSSSLEQIALLIIMTAIIFEEVNISINNKKFLFKGTWEGKTPLEWLTDSIRLLESV
jgi:hypothetical protein